MVHSTAPPPVPTPPEGWGRTLSLVLLLALLLGASGCSRTRLVYDRLDWVVSWRLDDYVSLRGEARRSFERDFDALWQWHRTRELPRYATDLRELAAAVGEPGARLDLADWRRRGEANWDRVVDQGADGACRLLAGLDDGQVTRLLARVDEGIDEARKRYVEAPVDEIRARAERRLLRNLERWLGELDDDQRAAAMAWNAQRPTDHPGWIARREAWRRALATQLAGRDRPGFCDATARLLRRADPDGGLHRPPDEAAAAWQAYLVGLLASLSDEQRRHLQDRLRELARDFEQLAADA